MPNINIRTFTEAGIRTYIPSMAALRAEIFREFPFLYPDNIEEETRYLRKLSQSKDAIAVLVFDGPKVVGCSIGYPLEEEPQEALAPFTERDINVSEYFHFGDSAVLKPYRGRGLGHHFFDLREAHAKKAKRFKYTCFSTVIRPDDHPRRPADHLSLENFWKKRGYAQHPDFKYLLRWQDFGSPNIEKPSAKPLIYWIKELSK